MSESQLKIVLTEEEQRKFNFLGRKLKQNLDRVVNSDVYRGIPDDVTKAAVIESIIKDFRSAQSEIIKSKALLRLIQSKEGIEQMITGVTKGRAFTPFQPSSR